MSPFDHGWNQKFQGQRVSEGEYDGLDSVEGVASGVVNEIGYAEPNQESGDEADEDLVHASRYFASKGPTTNVRSRGLSLFVEIHL